MWESGHKWLSWWNKVFLLRESSLIRHHYIYSSPLHLFTIIVFTYDHYIYSPPLHLFIIIMCESLNMSPHHEHLSSLQTPCEARAQTRFHHFDLSLASHFSSFQILPTTAISFFLLFFTRFFVILISISALKVSIFRQQKYESFYAFWTRAATTSISHFFLTSSLRLLMSFLWTVLAFLPCVWVL